MSVRMRGKSTQGYGLHSMSKVYNDNSLSLLSQKVKLSRRTRAAGALEGVAHSQVRCRTPQQHSQGLQAAQPSQQFRVLFPLLLNNK